MLNRTTSTTTPSSGSDKVYSAQADNVHDKSVVQSETQSMVSIESTKKITNCMPHLGDEYSHKLTEEINEAVFEPIKIVVGETDLQQQQQLLADANLRTSDEFQIQNDFERKLQQYIAKLDSEKEVNIRQKHILKSAHKYFNDDLSEDNCLKSTCMDDYMADNIDIIAEVDDGENYETIFRRYVVVIPVPTVELAPSTELAPAVPAIELVPTAEAFPIEPRCYRHYFIAGIIGLLVGMILTKVVK